MAAYEKLSIRLYRSHAKSSPAARRTVVATKDNDYREGLNLAGVQHQAYLQSHIETLEKQIVASYKDQNELLDRLEAALEENEALKVQLQEAQTRIEALNSGKPKAKRGRKANPQGLHPGLPAPTQPEERSSEATLHLDAAMLASQKRIFEIRAEATMLVEAVEDRAVVAVAKAQRKAAYHAAEVERLQKILSELNS